MAYLTRLCFEELCSQVKEYTGGAGVTITDDGVISADAGIGLLVVSELPQTGEQNTIYLVPKEDGEIPNLHDEYVYVNNAWELIGSTQIDLTDYYTKTQIDNLLAQKQDAISKTDILTALGYEETELTLTDTTGASVTKTILTKIDDTGGGI